jgi:hypothetical protein
MTLELIDSSVILVKIPACYQGTRRAQIVVWGLIAYSILRPALVEVKGERTQPHSPPVTRNPWQPLQGMPWLVSERSKSTRPLMQRCTLSDSGLDQNVSVSKVAMGKGKPVGMSGVCTIFSGIPCNCLPGTLRQDCLARMRTQL